MWVSVTMTGGWAGKLLLHTRFTCVFALSDGFLKDFMVLFSNFYRFGTILDQFLGTTDVLGVFFMILRRLLPIIRVYTYAYFMCR